MTDRISQSKRPGLKLLPSQQKGWTSGVASGLAVAIAGVCAWLSLWVWMGQGQVSQFEIASSSMSPNLAGPSIEFTCTRCFRQTLVGSDSAAAVAATDAFLTQAGTVAAGGKIQPKCLHCGGLLLPAALCTECGQRASPRVASLQQIADALNSNVRNRYEVTCRCVADLKVSHVPGATVFVQPFEASLPQRFDLVAFRLPHHFEAPDLDAADFDISDRETPFVKRVYGLPGDRIHFEDGDLFVNRKRFQKSVEQLQKVAIPVSTIEDWDRWQGLESHQEQVDTPTQGRTWFTRYFAYPGSNVDWIHQIPARGRVEELGPDKLLQESLVLDDYDGNQFYSWNMTAVPDLALEIQLASELRAPLHVTMPYLGEERHVILRPAGDRPQRNRATSAQAICKNSAVIAFCDHRILIQSDLESQQIPVQAIDTETQNETATITIQVEARTEFKTLTVLRDQFLRSDFPLVRKHEAVAAMDSGGILLDADSYFLVGDNLPVSIDSRNALGPIPGTSIMGRVLKMPAAN